MKEFKIMKEDIVKKFKITNENIYKKFGVRPLVLGTIFVGSMLIGGLTLGHSTNSVNNQNHTSVPIESSVDTPVESIGDDTDNLADTIITYINGYKFDIKDFDKVSTVSFTDGSDTEQFAIEDILVNSDNSYTINVNDGDVINSSFDNATLIDNDYEKRSEKELSKDLAKYTNVLVSFEDWVQDTAISALSVEKLNDDNMLLCDTEYDRLLISTENAVPYRECGLEEFVGFSKADERSTMYIVIGGKIVKLSDCIGWKDVTIDGSDFKIISVLNEDNKYREYLAKKEQTIYVRLKPNDAPSISGDEINLDGSKGMFEFEYSEMRDLYRNVREVILGDDNMYHITSDDKVEIVVSPRYYNFEYLDNKIDINLPTEQTDVERFEGILNSSESLPNPTYFEGVKSVKVNDTYLYSVDKSYYAASNTLAPAETNFGGLYSPSAVALVKNFIVSRMDEEYVIAGEEVDFVANINGEKISYIDPYIVPGAMTQLYAYKKIEVNGLECYSLIIKIDVLEEEQNLYFEMLVPKENIVIKGAEEKMGPTKVLTR